jgi:hypothetical protein
MNPGIVAAVCHEANRLYCMSIGDHSQPHWEDAPEWQKDSAIKGVKALVDNPELTPEQLHEAWCIEKVRTGWVHGPLKDPVNKQHPCLVSYAELPEDQKEKDHIFHSIVKALAGN